jgi:hypothetical protein
MSRTTITVDSTVRDRLADLARAHHRALGDELASLLDDAEERLFWERVSAGYARPWDEPATTDDAAAEFPEFAGVEPRGPLPTPAALADDMPDYLDGRAAG